MSVDAVPPPLGPPVRRRSPASIVWIVVLGVLLIAALTGGTLLLLEVVRLQAQTQELERMGAHDAAFIAAHVHGYDEYMARARE